MRNNKRIVIFLMLCALWTALASKERPTDLIIVLHDNSEENVKAFFLSYSKYELKKIHQHTSAVTKSNEMLCTYNNELITEEEILKLIREDERVRHIIRNLKLEHRGSIIEP